MLKYCLCTAEVGLCLQELEPQIEQLCSQLLALLDVNMEETEQVLNNMSPEEVLACQLLETVTNTFHYFSLSPVINSKNGKNSRYVIINALRCILSVALFDLGLPSFDTLMHTYRYSYREQWLTSLNAAIVFLRNIGSIYLSMSTFTACFCTVCLLRSF